MTSRTALSGSRNHLARGSQCLKRLFVTEESRAHGFNGIFLSVAVLAIYGLREASDIREPVYGVTVSTLVLVTLSDVAEMVTLVGVITLNVVMVKLANFFPPEMVTVAGTLATDGFELCSVTEIPELHAGLETWTVAVTGVPPLTEETKLRLVGGGGVTVNVVFSALRSDDAVRVRGVLLHCGVVVIETPKYLVPAGTVTVGGTEAAPRLLLERLTGRPPAGALTLKEMTSVASAPPGTEDGVTLIDESAGSNVSEECAVAPNKVAVMVPVVAEVTYEDLIVNVA